MNAVITAPKPRDILSICQSIRARWSQSKQRERQRLARVKQLELIRRLAADQGTGRHAV